MSGQEREPVSEERARSGAPSGSGPRTLSGQETQPERTVLSWQRTGLGVLALAGLLARAAVGGYVRWRRNEQAIAADRPLPPGRVLPALVAAVTAVLVVVAVLVGVEALRG